MTRFVKLIAISPQALLYLFAREPPAQGADELTTGKVQFPSGSHRGYCAGGQRHGGGDNNEHFHGGEGERRTVESSWYTKQDQCMLSAVIAVNKPEGERRRERERGVEGAVLVVEFRVETHPP